MKLLKTITLTTGVTVNHYDNGEMKVQTDTYLNCLKRGNARKRKECLVVS